MRLVIAVKYRRIIVARDLKHSPRAAIETRERMIDEDIVARDLEIELRDRCAA